MTAGSKRQSRRHCAPARPGAMPWPLVWSRRLLSRIRATAVGLAMRCRSVLVRLSRAAAGNPRGPLSIPAPQQRATLAHACGGTWDSASGACGTRRHSGTRTCLRHRCYSRPSRVPAATLRFTGIGPAATTTMPLEVWGRGGVAHPTRASSLPTASEVETMRGMDVRRTAGRPACMNSVAGAGATARPEVAVAMGVSWKRHERGWRRRRAR